MRVSQLNTTAEIISQIEGLNRKQLQLQQKVATGLEVQRPSDDPVAASEVIKIDSERKTSIQFRKNLEEANSLLLIGSENLQAFHDLVSRAREIVSLSGGTANDERMIAYSEEMEGLVEQAYNMVNSTYRGSSLFGGQATDMKPFSDTRDPDGKLTGVSYNGATATTGLQVAKDFSINTRLGGDDAAGFSTIIDNLIAARDALSNTDRSALSAADSGLGGAEDQILLSQADLNGDLARVEWIRSREDDRFLTLQESRSRAADADLAEVITQLNQAGVAYQAALQTSTLIMNQSLLNFL